MNVTYPEPATTAIFIYTFGMDTANGELATSRFAEQVEIDFSVVNGPKTTLSRAQFRDFVAARLGKADMRVHTAINQVLEDPTSPGEFVAYYSARHYRGPATSAAKFEVFGWYRFRLAAAGLVSALRIEVSASEGDPTAVFA